MKAPIPLPFVKKGEDVPPSGVTTQAVLGFVLPFLLIALMGLIIFFMLSARLSESPMPHTSLLGLLAF
jgi:hypothetical protein